MDVVLLILAGSGLVMLYSAVKNYSPIEVMKAGLNGPKPSPDHYHCEKGSSGGDSKPEVSQATEPDPCARLEAMPSNYAGQVAECAKNRLGSVFPGGKPTSKEDPDACVKRKAREFADTKRQCQQATAKKASAKPTGDPNADIRNAPQADKQAKNPGRPGGP